MFAAVAAAHRVLVGPPASTSGHGHAAVTPRSPGRAVVYRGTVVHSVVIGELIVLKDTSVGVRGDGTIGECVPNIPWSRTTHTDPTLACNSTGPTPHYSMVRTIARVI